MKILPKNFTKLIFTILTLTFLFSSPAIAQYSQKGAAVLTGATLPVKCSPGSKRNSLFLKTGTAAGLYTCNATDTWTLSGGASGSATKFDPDAPYTAPSTYDDEFDGASLNAKWTRNTTGVTPTTITANTPPHHLTINTTASTQGFGYYQTPPASGNWKYRAKVRSTSGSSYAGIYVKTGAGNYIAVGFIIIGGSYKVTRYTFSSLSTPLTGAELAGNPSGDNIYLGYVEIEYTSGILYVNYSVDGVIFPTRVSQGASTTPTEIGFYGYTNADIPIYFDWFRKVDATGFTGRTVSVQ